MIKEGIEKEGVSRTFLCLDLAHQAVAASAGLLSRGLVQVLAWPYSRGKTALVMRLDL